ncbi:putative membrane protein [Francisella philomiragia]|uniref:Putative membrane protein n=1 Tax=Francisella philomiragia TaxID=28110 RepID=A0A0B6CVN2_9GAMM|nr:putative membrane protein [Francisella philomiragia]
MPGILISFILLFISVSFAWFSWRLGIIMFSIFLIVAGLVFLHHATDHLTIYL